MTRVRIVPVISDREPEDIEVSDEATVGEAILSRFPDLQGNRLVIQDREGRPINATAPARGHDSVSFMTFSEGGLGDRNRTETEVRQLMDAHPSVARYGDSLVCSFSPGIGGRIRVIRLEVPRFYPDIQPEARVQPSADIAGDVEVTHIFSNGRICLTNHWNERKHTLAWALSQGKYLVCRACKLRHRW